MEKDEAARLLGKGSPTIGTFFVRERGEADYVLALWFGKPGGAPQATQHLITKNPETGCYCVNKRQIGEAKTIVKFIKQLFEPVDGWCACGGCCLDIWCEGVGRGGAAGCCGCSGCGAFNACTK